MPILDLTSIPEHKGSSYPSPFDKESADRIRQRLGDAGGLTQFGVNRLQLPPGAWSSQRHWHSAEDEFVYVISGEVVLISDRGQEALRAGDCAAFPKDVPNGQLRDVPFFLQDFVDRYEGRYHDVQLPLPMRLA
jgi:uncharacterized cupin superfamily protein